MTSKPTHRNKVAVEIKFHRDDWAVIREVSKKAFKIEATELIPAVIVDFVTDFLKDMKEEKEKVAAQTPDPGAST